MGNSCSKKMRDAVAQQEEQEQEQAAGSVPATGPAPAGALAASGTAPVAKGKGKGKGKAPKGNKKGGKQAPAAAVPKATPAKPRQPSLFPLALPSWAQLDGATAGADAGASVPALPESEAGNKGLALALEWYKRDTNFRPARFVLQAVSHKYPHFNDPSGDAKKAAGAAWWADQVAMTQSLRAKAPGAGLLPEEELKYRISVTHSEIIAAKLTKAKASEGAGAAAVWFRRKFDGLDTSDAAARLFMDVSDGKVDAEAQALLQGVCEEMAAVIPADRIHNYSVPWQAGKGIDAAGNPQHKAYIDRLCADANTELRQAISAAAALPDPFAGDVLAAELARHAHFCQERCETFHGRDEPLAAIASFLGAPKAGALLVVNGPSGSGKSSVMAKAAMLASQGGKGATILRFLGTTPDSSTLRQLLRTLCQQIYLLYGRSPARLPEDTKALVEEFATCLQFPTSSKPLTLFLDSLDQLADSEGALAMNWMPLHIPGNVRVVLSTLPEAKYVVMPSLKEKFGDKATYVQIPAKLGEAEAEQIFRAWLDDTDRNLSVAQWKIVRDAVQEGDSTSPLVLRLIFQQCLEWHSFDEVAADSVRGSARSLIIELFEDLERQHGLTFVRHALGYLTCARDGLSENELEDILSCDDKVLNELFEWWLPPIRRVPPLLWARVRRALGAFLVDRGVGNNQLLQWHHRLFIEAARERYLAGTGLDGVDMSKAFHTAIAEYFEGKWDSVPKPCTFPADMAKRFDKPSAAVAEMRFVASQPLVLSTENGVTVFNTRKLRELPWNLCRAGLADQFATKYLASTEWLQAKLLSMNRQECLEDFDLAAQFPAATPVDKPSLVLVKRTIRDLTAASQLPSFLLERLSVLERHDEFPTVAALLQDLRTKYPASAVSASLNATILMDKGYSFVQAASLENDSLLKIDLGEEIYSVKIAKNDRFVFLLTQCSNLSDAQKKELDCNIGYQLVRVDLGTGEVVDRLLLDAEPTRMMLSGDEQWAIISQSRRSGNVFVDLRNWKAHPVYRMHFDEAGVHTESGSWCVDIKRAVCLPTGELAVYSGYYMELLTWTPPTSLAMKPKFFDFRNETNNCFPILNSDGSTILWGGDERVIACNTKTGKAQNFYASKGLSRYCLSQDDKDFYVLGKEIICYDFETAQPKRRIECDNYYSVMGFQLSPDETTLFTHDGSELVALVAETLVPSRTVKTHSSSTSSSCHSITRPHHAAAGFFLLQQNSSVAKIDLESKYTEIINYKVAEEKFPYSFDGCRWSTDMKALAYWHGQEVHICDPESLTKTALPKLEDEVFAVTSDHKTAFTWTRRDGINCVDLSSKKTVWTSTVPVPGEDDNLSLSSRPRGLLSDDGSRVVIAGKADDKPCVAVLDAAKGTVLTTAVSDAEDVSLAKALSMNSDNSVVCVGTERRGFLIFDLAAGRAIHIRPKEKCECQALAITPDSKSVIVSFCDEDFLRKHRLSDGALEFTFARVSGCYNSEIRTAMCISGDLVYIGNTERLFWAMDWRTGEQRQGFSPTNDQSAGTPNMIAVSRDHILCFGSQLVRYSTRVSGNVYSSQGHSDTASFVFPVGDRKVVTMDTNAMYTWDVTGDFRCKNEGLIGDHLETIADSRGETMSPVANQAGTQCFMATLESMYTVDLATMEMSPPTAEAGQHNTLQTLITADDKHLVVALSNEVVIWDTTSKSRVAILSTGEPASMCLSGDQSMVLVGDTSSHVTVFKLSGKLVTTFSKHEGDVTDIISMGEAAVSLDSSGLVFKWTVASGAVVEQLIKEDSGDDHAVGRPTKLVPSPKYGQFVMIGEHRDSNYDDQGNLHFWDASSVTPLRTFVVSQTVGAAVFCEDGLHLFAACCPDSTSGDNGGELLLYNIGHEYPIAKYALPSGLSVRRLLTLGFPDVKIFMSASYESHSSYAQGGCFSFSVHIPDTFVPCEEGKAGTDLKAAAAALGASPLGKALLGGSLAVALPTQVRAIRAFVSSTFTDTQQERDALMERVYPGLREFARGQGIDFQVASMRWGVNSEAGDKHQTEELCLREIAACQAGSSGLNFISLYAQKYGYRPLPAQVDASEFEQLVFGTAPSSTALKHRKTAFQ